MMKIRAFAGIIMLLSLVAGSIACTGNGGGIDPDGGYEGTWSRQSGPVTSAVMLKESDGEYLVRLAVSSEDGELALDCDWEGYCEETIAGQKTNRYELRTSVDPQTGHLIVDYDISDFHTGELKFHYTDEFEIRQDGVELVVYTNRRNDQEYVGGSRPERRFDKISNEVSGNTASGERQDH